MAWGKRLNRSVEEGCTYISPDYIWTFLYHDNALPREHLFLASWFRFRENGKSIVDTWQIVETISWNVLRSCGIKRQMCPSNAIYIYFSFFHACGKNKLFQTRLYARRDCFEDFYEFWKQGGRLAGHLEKFFQVSSRAVDRYLCRGNYQRLRWRYGDPTKDKNFGAWASSPQVSRRWVYEKGAAPILGERIHLRGDREHLEGVSVSNDAFQDAQKIETFIL